MALRGRVAALLRNLAARLHGDRHDAAAAHAAAAAHSAALAQAAADRAVAAALAAGEAARAGGRGVGDGWRGGLDSDLETLDTRR